jgi:hypothetical protein
MIATLDGSFDGSKQQPRLRDGQDITSTPDKIQHDGPLADARGPPKTAIDATGYQLVTS